MVAITDSSRESRSNGSVRGPEAATPKPSRENIFSFVPNSIGYARIFLALVSLYFMPLHPRRCSFLYSISCLLDASDGYAARAFNQSTKFGAVSDMVTDRCTTTCSSVFSSTAKPRWSMSFQSSISSDFTSHYMHMYATSAMGGSGKSHKSVDKSRSWILNLYYSNRNVLFVCCASNELFFIALYLLAFSSPIISPALLQPEPSTLQPGNPAVSPKPSTSFANPWSAGAMEMARANKMDSTVPWVSCVISFPVMAFKQWVNIVQIVKASKWLAEGDSAERAKLAEKKQ